MLDMIDAELLDVKARLSKHYDTIETGKLSPDDLSPRIKELKAMQDELTKARVQVEADMGVEGVQHVDLEAVKSYAQDLCRWLEEGDFTRSKTFLRSFVKKVIIKAVNVLFITNFPYPLPGKRVKIWFCLLNPQVEPGGFEPPTFAMRTRRSPE